MDKKAMYNLTYGLFVLTARAGGRDSGCIINTAGQVTSTPNRISIAVNKENFTHGLVLEEQTHSCSVDYESVMGRGLMDELTEEGEKRHALDRIMHQYHAEDFPYNPAPIPKTRILRLRVQERTAKRRKKF